MSLYGHLYDIVDDPCHLTIMGRHTTAVSPGSSTATITRSPDTAETSSRTRLRWTPAGRCRGGCRRGSVRRYVRLVAGAFVNTAFVIDAYAGRILGWECSTTKHTRFVESEIRQAAALRAREGRPVHDGALRGDDHARRYEAGCTRPRRSDRNPHFGYVRWVRCATWSTSPPTGCTGTTPVE